jgi:hypothetical protein
MNGMEGKEEKLLVLNGMEGEEEKLFVMNGRKVKRSCWS